MARAALNRDRVSAAGAERVPQRDGGVEPAALLIEIGARQRVGDLHRPLVRRQVADQHAQQRALARPARPENADAVTPQDAGAEILHQEARTALPARPGFRDALRFDDRAAALPYPAQDEGGGGGADQQTRT